MRRYWREQHLFQGTGVYTYANGSQYKGDFKQGLFNGKGTLFSDGQIYVGEFKDGDHYGKGTITYYDKSQEIGEWRNGEFVVLQQIAAPKQTKKETAEEDELLDIEEFKPEDFGPEEPIDTAQGQDNILAPDDFPEENQSAVQ